MTTAVEFKNVDIIFGARSGEALAMARAGEDRSTILARTGAVLGATGANLVVSEGEISVLMGLSGSGKSTLLRAVNGLNKVTGGAVLVKDQDRMVDVATCNAATLRHIRQKQVAMVFQQFALLPWRTVRENAGLGLELAGMPDAERNAKVDKQLKLVGLEQWANKYVHELSGGMQQRVGLARAFATEAPIHSIVRTHGRRAAALSASEAMAPKGTAMPSLASNVLKAFKSEPDRYPSSGTSDTRASFWRTRPSSTTKSKGCQW